MKKQEIDYILNAMLESYEEVSDLNFTAGKPLQVETSGELVSVKTKRISCGISMIQASIILSS